MAELPAPVSHTVTAIHAAYEAKADRFERGYLGMSTMGDECDRALWYSFRWASPPEHFDGRKLRLFETGHREEARMLDDLRAAGVQVEEIDPSTGKQWALEAIDGHFRGHLDGLGTGIAEAPKAEHVLEFKTHSEKSFKDLQKKGVKDSKPGHYAQMQLYMHFSGVGRAFYLAHNKNTDELHGERIAYDPVYSLALATRAERIIQSPRPLPKAHDDPTSKAAFACGWCKHRATCHEAHFARSHCRTCLHASPAAGGKWHCARWDKLLNQKAQAEGCPAHRFIPDLVPGEQTDVIGDDVIVYQLAAGGEFRDGEGR